MIFTTSRSNRAYIGLILFGLLINVISAVSYYYLGITLGLYLLLTLAAMLLYLLGAIAWCRFKNRSLWFCLLVIIAPIGLLGILFLSNKRVSEPGTI